MNMTQDPQMPTTQSPPTDTTQQPSPAGGQSDGGPVPPDVLDHLQGQLANAEAEFERLIRKHGLDQKQLEDARREFLAQLFQDLKSAGVDPADPSSIQAFMANLKQQSPDLARLFDFAFSILSQPSPAGAGGTMPRFDAVGGISPDMSTIPTAANATSGAAPASPGPSMPPGASMPPGPSMPPGATAGS